jgi:bile acid-coenzyme A ligase
MQPPAATSISMGETFTYQAKRDPDRVAVICGEESITRKELESQANRAARAFAELGVGHGDLVTIALPNGIDFYIAVAAVWKLGATPAPLSYRLPDIERNAIIELAQPALVIGVDPERVTGRPALAPGWQPSPDLADDPLPSAVSPSWVALASGGSTGRPKVIVNARQATVDPTAPISGMQIDGVQLVPGPLYHNGPFTFSLNGLFTGSTIVLMQRFEAAAVLELIEKHRVDWIFAVPTMLRRIWQLPPEVRESADLSSLRLIFSSGSPWPAWLKEEYLNWIGPDRILEVYGGTEQNGSTMITGRESLEHPGSVGKALPGHEVRILDPETGADLPPREIGEVFFAVPGGPGSTYRYLGAEAKVRDGRETLGDLGYLDADGYLYLVDRRTDLVVSGGANIYPAEVEAALERHPQVRSAAVVGLPDDDLGNRVHAIVDVGQAAPEHHPDHVALRSHLREHLAPYKVPRTFEFVTHPLRDDAGKVRRSALREARLTPQQPPPQEPLSTSPATKEIS